MHTEADEGWPAGYVRGSAALIQQDIRRIEISMYDSMLMREVEGASDTRQQAYHLVGWWNVAMLCHHKEIGGQRDAFDIFCHYPEIGGCAVSIV